MGLDTSIPLQARAPDAMQSLASMLSVATGAQNLKKAQATYNSDVSQRASEASAADSNAQVAKATIAPRIAQQNEAANQSGIKTALDQFKLTGDQLDKANQIGQGLLGDPDISSGDMTKIVPKIMSAKQRMIESGIPASTAEVQAAHLITAAAQNPQGLPQLLKNSIVQSQPAAQQAGLMQPNIVQNSNGQQIVSSNVNTFAPGGVGSQPIAPIQMQLPPTTPTVEGGVPGYLGPQGDQSQGGFDPSRLTPQQKAAMIKDDPQAYANGLESFYKRGQAKQPRVASGMPVGATDAIAGTQGAVNDDWKKTVESSTSSERDIGILQSIKQHAAGAASGVGADKANLAAGIAGLLGIDAGTLQKTDADLLAKNSAMLALAGGDTNLARTMAEAATPNSHMTASAIRQAADQIIAQRKLALARMRFLTPFKAMADQGHPEMYNQALTQFNSVADPRVIQFSSMSPEERIAMKSAMTPQERDEFGAKLGKARKLGVAQ